MRDSRFTMLLARPLDELLISDVARDLGEASKVEEIETFSYIQFPKMGVSMDLGTNSRVAAIFFDHARVSSEWATGISPKANREQVLRLFGSPSRSGDKRTLAILGSHGAWDRWDYPDHSLHVQYSPVSGTVEKVTLMHSSAVPP